MINKVSKPLVTTRLTNIKRVQKDASPPPSTDTDSLVDKILQSLTIDALDNTDNIRKQLILKTLTQALGERASNEVAFKRILQKIDDTLKDDVSADLILKELKNTYYRK